MYLNITRCCFHIKHFGFTNVYKQIFLCPLTSFKNLHFKFNTFVWRMSYRCHYIFTKILKSVQKLIFMILFFTAWFAHTHYRIVFILRRPRIHQTRLLQQGMFNSVHCFTLSFNLWGTWQQRQCCNSLLLHYVWRNNIAAQLFLTTIPRELYSKCRYATV